MKFKIEWLEHHICVDEKEEKEILDYLPIGSRINGYDKDQVEFDCVDTFEANNIEEAKKIVEEDYSEVEIFNVSDETGKTVFTEEDFE